tara:strand:+ start:146 stop:628 length:483 start_codon:yes stop_codon:yes gene_type:complete
MVKEIKLTRGFVALVDDEDFERVSKLKWHATEISSIDYAKHSYHENGKNLTLYLHRFVMKITDRRCVVDHIDRDGLDCRKKNLRVCTQAQNTMNGVGSKNSTSKYKGVSLVKRNKKWRSQIMKNGKNMSLGDFKSEIEAARVYNEKAKELFGEFALLNPV